MSKSIISSLTIVLAVLTWAGTLAASESPDKLVNGLSSSQQSAQDDLIALTPGKFYNELTYNPYPLKAQVQLKKPENIDRVKVSKESRENLIIKRALSLDTPVSKKAEAEEGRETAVSAGDQSGPSFMDVPLAPGAKLNMSYRYLDYNKVNDAGLPFATTDVPKAYYYGKPAEGHEQTAHEISFGVQVDLK